MKLSKSAKKLQTTFMKKGNWMHVVIGVCILLLIVSVFWPRKKLGIRMVPVDGTPHFKAILEPYGNEEPSVTPEEPSVTPGKPSVTLYKANWCGHCKKFSPEWEKCKNDKELTNKVDIITIDADENKQACKDAGVTGYPTIHTKNKAGEVSPYNDERTFAALKKYCLQNL